MIGLFGLLAYFVIGTAVAAFEGGSQDSWEVTAIATAGAFFGASVGGSLGLHVALGELPGFLCSVAGAVLFVRVYQSQIVGTRFRGLAPASAREPAPMPLATDGPAVPPSATPSIDRPPTLFSLIAEAFGWGTIGALPTAVAGFLGHLLGSSLYPQQYEQIPSDFFFVPLGLVVGFVTVALARLARRDWGASATASVVALVTVLYGGALFQYSRTHALPARVDVSLEPATVEAIPCSPDACSATDPPAQWSVTGRLRIKTSRQAATIDRIEITSETEPRDPVRPQRYTKEAAAEAARWRGPLVTLTGRHIPGPRRLVPETDSTYPITYPYYTRDGMSRRRISISVYLTDAPGNAAYASATWRVP